jgi:hypothetical protein
MFAGLPREALVQCPVRVDEVAAPIARNDLAVGLKKDVCVFVVQPGVR